MDLGSEIYRAADEGADQDLHMLLSEPANEQLTSHLNYQTPHGKTALYAACSNNHTGCVGMLLSNKAAPDLAHSSGTTPLMVAAYFGYTDCVQMLLAAGADSLLKDKRGQSALEIARSRGHTGVEKAILEDATKNVTAEARAAQEAEAKAQQLQCEAVAAAQSRDTVAWLLLLLEDVGCARNESVLAAALEFCEREGATEVGDVAKYGLAKDFVAALSPLGRIVKAKLLEALRPPPHSSGEASCSARSASRTPSAWKVKGCRFRRCCIARTS